MSVPTGVHINSQMAHEICVREAAAATIEGSIASLGKDDVVTLEAITCKDGTTLAREQVQAEDKEQVLNAVGTAATELRAKLGESLSSIQKLNRPLAQALRGCGRHGKTGHRNLEAFSKRDPLEWGAATCDSCRYRT